MKKLTMHTPDITAENIEKLAALFPNCVVEAENPQIHTDSHRLEADEKICDHLRPSADKKLRRMIDFDQLRQELSDHIVDGPRERYHLDWPGKRGALLAANAPIAKTLRPCREESVDFDTTKNRLLDDLSG